MCEARQTQFWRFVGAAAGSTKLTSLAQTLSAVWEVWGLSAAAACSWNTGVQPTLEFVVQNATTCLYRQQSRAHKA